MPLKISEIGVRLAIGESPAAGACRTGPGEGRDDPAGPGLTPAQMDELVERCVRKVIRALRTLEGR